MTDHPSPMIQRLIGETSCPVCGKRRANLAVSPASADRPIATSHYECGSHFEASRKSINVSTPCRAGSDLAARLMTMEAECKGDKQI